jgi:hypothetical protein
MWRMNVSAMAATWIASVRMSARVTHFSGSQEDQVEGGLATKVPGAACRWPPRVTG